MTAATFEDHPTDPTKVILRKKPHLDKGRDYEEGFVDGMQYQMQSSVDKAVNAMAQPEQEPVAWMDADGKTFPFVWNVASLGVRQGSKYLDESLTPLYTTPPQRTWVGLTDEDRQAGFESMPNMLDGFLKTWGWLHFSKAIEAKLKDKNCVG